MKKPRSENKTRYTKNCIFCGVEFIATRSDARFCNGSHKSMYGQNIRRDLEAAKIADTQGKIKLLIQEIQKSDQAEAKEFGDWLKKWLSKFSDKLRTAIKNHDLQALEEIRIKLEKTVEKLTVIENE